MQSNHTPGPLYAVGGAVAKGREQAREFIANCNCNDLPADERIANSVLFAAAPDLLAACERVAEMLRIFGYADRGGDGSTYDVLLAAIAKAKGGAA